VGWVGLMPPAAVTHRPHSRSSWWVPPLQAPVQAVAVAAAVLPRQRRPPRPPPVSSSRASSSERWTRSWAWCSDAESQRARDPHPFPQPPVGAAAPTTAPAGKNRKRAVAHYTRPPARASGVHAAPARHTGKHRHGHRDSDTYNNAWRRMRGGGVTLSVAPSAAANPPHTERRPTPCTDRRRGGWAARGDGGGAPTHTCARAYSSIVSGDCTYSRKAASQAAPTAPSTTRWSDVKVTVM
jgi:hypothetical protein